MGTSKRGRKTSPTNGMFLSSVASPIYSRSSWESRDHQPEFTDILRGRGRAWEAGEEKGVMKEAGHCCATFLLLARLPRSRTLCLLP